MKEETRFKASLIFEGGLYGALKGAFWFALLWSSFMFGGYGGGCITGGCESPKAKLLEIGYSSIVDAVISTIPYAAIFGAFVGLFWGSWKTWRCTKI